MAGSLTISYGSFIPRDVKKAVFDWTSDAAGNVSGIVSGSISGEIVRVVFSPGAGGVQPTDLYDVTLLDEDGFDVLGTLGANLSNANKSQVVPLTGDGTTTNQRVFVDGVLELIVAAAGNAKQGRVTVYYR